MGSNRSGILGLRSAFGSQRHVAVRIRSLLRSARNVGGRRHGTRGAITGRHHVVRRARSRRSRLSIAQAVGLSHDSDLTTERFTIYPTLSFHWDLN